MTRKLGYNKSINYKLPDDNNSPLYPGYLWVTEHCSIFVESSFAPSLFQYQQFLHSMDQMLPNIQSKKLIFNI